MMMIKIMMLIMRMKIMMKMMKIMKILTMIKIMRDIMMIKIMSNIMMIKINFMFRISKWFVPLEEYPYNRWPAYVTAGNIIKVQTR